MSEHQAIRRRIGRVNRARNRGGLSPREEALARWCLSSLFSRLNRARART